MSNLRNVQNKTLFCKSDFWHAVFLSSIRGLAYKAKAESIASAAARVADAAVEQAQERNIVEK